jgi:hypothetical protein
MSSFAFVRGFLAQIGRVSSLSDRVVCCTLGLELVATGRNAAKGDACGRRLALNVAPRGVEAGRPPAWAAVADAAFS